jgi:hypothetical protein
MKSKHSDKNIKTTNSCSAFGFNPFYLSDEFKYLVLN